MGVWWVKHLKHKELYYWYQEQSQPKSKRVVFCSRVVRYWYDKEKALQIENLHSEKTLKRYWSVIGEDGRVCNKCKQYKQRDFFARSKVWVKWHTSICKECRNKTHQEYRLNWWYKKDQEFKKRKRKLNKWDQIYFQNEIWEVGEYKNKKWYTVKSIMNWTERRISTMDNHNRHNTNCVRFTKLETPVILKESEKGEEAIKPKFKISLDDLLN